MMNTTRLKQGARHNAEDRADMQVVHDIAARQGAECAPAVKELAMGKRADRIKAAKAKARHEASMSRALARKAALDEAAALELEEKELPIPPAAPEDDGDEPETGEKMMGDYSDHPPRPYAGATSWEELDSFESAVATRDVLMSAYWQFQTLVENVMADETIADKGAAISALAAGMEARIRAEQAAEMKEIGEKYGTSPGAEAGHATQGHEAGGSGSGGGGTGGGEGGGGGGGGYASARDEWKMVNKRLAVGNLKRGERKLLEERAEKLAKKILGVEKETAEKAVTKSEPDGDHPAAHYLVVEDSEKPTTWHLRVKGKDGKPDHTLMGAAWAALHEGYRGSVYEGPEKGAALAALKAMYKSEEMEMPGGKETGLLQGVLGWLKERLGNGEKESPGVYDVRSELSALKGADGRNYLMLHTTNALRDRDREIFTDAALKAYAEIAAPGQPVDYWHTDWEPGVVSWTGHGGRTLFELVELNDDRASKELAADIAARPNHWACSHRFHFAPAERETGIFTTLVKSKSTLLPVRAAANPYTAVAALKGEVRMDTKKLDELKGILSPEAFAQAQAFITGEEGKAARLVEAGVETKEVTSPAPAELPPAAVAIPTVPVDPNAQLAAVITQALQTGLAPLEARLAALETKEKAIADMPRAAAFFGDTRASLSGLTALAPGVLADVGPGQKALTPEDPMIASLKAIMGAQQ